MRWVVKNVSRRWLAGVWVGVLCSLPAWAGLGQSEVMSAPGERPATVFYPSRAPEQPVQRGGFTLSLAAEGPVAPGNGRLIVISHGSGGNPWTHEQLARRLVDQGFVVLVPWHDGDSTGDHGHPGPDSWARRPREVSRAIDAVARDARFAPGLALDRVGVYGFSAGGVTALTLAGGRWSATAYRDHCLANLAADFQTCVGLLTQLTGGAFDGLKQWLVRQVMRARYTDAQWHAHRDPRVVAVVAAAPHAVAFDLPTLATPAVPLGLVTLGQDRWLVPRFHSDRVLAACASCDHIAHLDRAGHGAMLSPLPPRLSGLAGAMLSDPPGFDRRELPALDQKITAFFERHLLGAALQ